MLFMCFLAGVMGSTGWMIFWAIMGMLFSARSFMWFIFPLVAAAMGEPKLAVLAIVFSWVVLFVRHVEDINRRSIREKVTVRQDSRGAVLEGVTYNRQGKEL